MVFDARPPDARDPHFEIIGNYWKIYATGEIDEDAPGRLESLISDRGIPFRSVLYLESPGGNLQAGLELGRVIRKHGFVTYVGNSDREEIVPCFSACTLAYLGGYFRFYDPNAAYGMHRFYFPAGVEIAIVIDSRHDRTRRLNQSSTTAR